MRNDIEKPGRWDGFLFIPNPDPIRPPETDEEPWTVALPPADPRPAFPTSAFVIALGVIVGILIAWAVR